MINEIKRLPDDGKEGNINNSLKMIIKKFILYVYMNSNKQQMTSPQRFKFSSYEKTPLFNQLWNNMAKCNRLPVNSIVEHLFHYMWS